MPSAVFRVQIRAMWHDAGRQGGLPRRREGGPRSQTVEIAAMRGRMVVLRAEPNPQPGGYPALGAVRGGG